MSDQDSQSPALGSPSEQTPDLVQAYQDLVGREEFVAAKDLSDKGVTPELSLLRFHIIEITRHAMQSSHLPAAIDLLTVLNRALQAVARLSRIQQILAAAGEPASVAYQREMDRIRREIQDKIGAGLDLEDALDFTSPPLNPP